MTGVWSFQLRLGSSRKSIDTKSNSSSSSNRNEFGTEKDDDGEEDDGEKVATGRARGGSEQSGEGGAWQEKQGDNASAAPSGGEGEGGDIQSLPPPSATANHKNRSIIKAQQVSRKPASSPHNPRHPTPDASAAPNPAAWDLSEHEPSLLPGRATCREVAAKFLGWEFHDSDFRVSGCRGDAA